MHVNRSIMPHTLAAASCLALSALAAAQTAPAPASAPTIIYQSQYADPKNLALWSKPQTDNSAGTLFLGRFYNVTESLALPPLPPHAFVRLRAQLCILDSWDGNAPGDGPDQLAIRLGDGRTLLQSTFTIYGPNDKRITAPPKQSFPDNYGTGSYPGLTGAEAADVKWLPKSKETWGGNAVYTVEFTFPHTARDLRIDFRSALIDSQPTIDNESWGLGNVEVAVLPEAPVKLTLEQVRELIAGLRADEPVAANKALGVLISAGDGVVDTIQKGLESPTPVAAEHVAALIKQLDDDKYAAREAAQKELEAGGRDTLALCAQALQAGPPPEAETRLQLIVRKLQSHGINKLDQRLGRVLEIIGSNKALALRARLYAAPPLPDMDAIRQVLKVDSADEWMVLSVKISQVMTLLSDPAYAVALRDASARANMSPEMQNLRTLLQGTVSDAALKTAMVAVRAQRGPSILDPALQLALDTARNNLRKVLTIRQEAALMTLNILE